MQERELSCILHMICEWILKTVFIELNCHSCKSYESVTKPRKYKLSTGEIRGHPVEKPVESVYNMVNKYLLSTDLGEILIPIDKKRLLCYDASN